MEQHSNSLLKDLAARGLIQDITPKLDEHLNSGQRTAYIGFDPTATSLHIGSLLPLNLLVHLQKSGHRAIALVGGATAMIGDPSGKTDERKLLSDEDIKANQVAVAAQIKKYLAAHNCGDIEIVNNLDWIGQFSFIDFLRNVGKSLTVNYMMAKDSVKKRLETGISFTEFSYQLLQAYDFQYLFEHKNCSIQMGGSDQWGNIISGTELIRRQLGAEGYAFTTPLVTKADGSKFGKSEGGNVWLDAGLTSAYKFFQFWLNVADVEAAIYMRKFTFLPLEEIEILEAEHAEEPHLRLLQKRLANEVTTYLHGSEGLAAALLTTDLLFGKGQWADWQSLTEGQFADAIEGLPTYEIKSIDNMDVLSAMVGCEGENPFPSKGEARKMANQGGLMLNLQKVTGQESVSRFELLHGQYIIGQKGKKNFFVLRLGK